MRKKSNASEATRELPVVKFDSLVQKAIKQSIWLGERDLARPKHGKA